MTQEPSAHASDDPGPPESPERGSSYRMRGVMSGAVVAAVLWMLPTPEGLTSDAHAVAVMSAVMVMWWVGQVLPMAVTAMVPLIVLPLVGTSSLAEVARSYAHPLLYLMLGGFVLGHGMERVGLHLRLTAWMLGPERVRRSPRSVLAVLMLVCAVLSGLISNTATTLMMLPLATSLAARCGGGRLRPAFVLGLAWSASIGGMSTLVGTPPNAVFAGMSETLLQRSIGFGSWMWVGVPTVLLMLPIAWWTISSWGFALGRRFDTPLVCPEVPAPHPAERVVLGIAGLALLAWLTRSDKMLGIVTIPGWSRWFDARGTELDAVVALVAAFAIFLVPSGRSDRAHLVRWGEAERAIPWSVLLLLGGGFAMAAAIGSSGLTAWLASGAVALRGLPLPVTVLALCLVMTFVTEVTSNTATATIALPLLAEAAVAAGVDPMAWMVPATLSASCAFMMPIATAPNAIASQAGGVEARDMARAGLVLNLLGALVVTGVGVVWAPWVFR